MKLGLVVLSLAVLIFSWLFLRSLFRWRNAASVCESDSATTDAISTGVLLVGTLLLLLNAVVLL